MGTSPLNDGSSFARKPNLKVLGGTWDCKGSTTAASSARGQAASGVRFGRHKWLAAAGHPSMYSCRTFTPMRRFHSRMVLGGGGS